MKDLRSMRVSLKFSEKDSDHVAVARLLKQLGRKKASFIVKAVKYYVENSPAPEIPGSNPVVTSMVTEAMVKATILKMLQTGELQPGIPQSIPAPKRTLDIPQIAEQEESVEEVKSTEKEEKPVEKEEKPAKPVEDKKKAYVPHKPVKVSTDTSVELSEDDYVDSDSEDKENNEAVKDMLSMLEDF